MGGGGCLRPSVSARSAFCSCFASFRLWLACAASCFPRERKGHCCVGLNTYAQFFPSGSRGAKVAHLEHSFVTCLPAADPGTGTWEHVYLFSLAAGTLQSPLAFSPWFLFQKSGRGKKRRKDTRQTCPTEIFPSKSFQGLALKYRRG